MAAMIIFPAIDLRGGRCVRLRQGRPDQETVFSDNPAATARHWGRQGAAWLHVVDLDAALGAGSANSAAVAAIVAAAGIPVQLGGGLRSAEDIAAAFALGAQRVVLGTVAVSQPEVVQSALQRFGSARIVAGIDSRAGKVAVRGWQETSELDALTLALRMKALGIERLVFTDISRDGTLAGPNLDAQRRMAELSGLRIIASGGVSSLDDLRALAAIPGVEGAIVGQALYSGAFTLPAALAAVGTSAASAVRGSTIS